MTGIEVAPVGERTGFAVCQEARRRGVWVRPLGDVVVLMPPLAIGDDDLETLVRRRRREHPRGGAMSRPLDAVAPPAGAGAGRAAGLRRRAAPRAPPTTTCSTSPSNDYLGLARDPRVIERRPRPPLRRGAPGRPGPGWSPGSTDLHAGLEAALADFVGRAAGAGLLLRLPREPRRGHAPWPAPARWSSPTPHNHASLVDACRLARARRRGRAAPRRRRRGPGAGRPRRPSAPWS